MIKLKLQQEMKKKEKEKDKNKEKEKDKEKGVKPISEIIVNPKSTGEIYLIKEMP